MKYTTETAGTSSMASRKAFPGTKILATELIIQTLHVKHMIRPIGPVVKHLDAGFLMGVRKCKYVFG